MTDHTVQGAITDQLHAMNVTGDYPTSLVCTEEGLLIASAGESMSDEELAGFTALFDDIVVRAGRDLGMGGIDEVTLLDENRGRLVIRPLYVEELRLFLVVRVPARTTWRRNTNRLCARLPKLMAPMVAELVQAEDAEAPE